MNETITEEETCIMDLIVVGRNNGEKITFTESPRFSSDYI